MVDVEAIVGAENMNLSSKPQVIALLKALPTPGVTKRYLYGRWLRLLGHHPQPADLDAVATWGEG